MDVNYDKAGVPLGPSSQWEKNNIGTKKDSMADPSTIAYSSPTGTLSVKH